ncbi:MAG: hypothetical protein ABR589_09110 [Chthoniobacterales bacterium]
MKAIWLAPLIVAASLNHSIAASAAAQPSIRDIPEAREALRRIVSPKFYRSLEISPIEGRITVRGLLYGTHLVAAKLVRSDRNGAYDSLALA